MSLTAAMIDALVASGATAEMLAAVMKAALADDDAKANERRAKDAERQRLHRERKGLSRSVTVTACDSRDATPPCPLDGPPKDISNPPLNPPSPPVLVNARRAIAKPISGFAEFWAAYPRKTAKAAAEKAWPKACQRQTPAAIIAAATRYAADPPDDPQFIPHPASWLNAARFEDEEPTDARPTTSHRPLGSSGRGQPMGRSDGPRAGQFRRDPAFEGLKRLHAELASGGGSEAFEGY